MRPLLIDNKVKQRAKEIVEFAKRHENWYRPWIPPFPGDQPELTMLIPVGYRAAFSYTIDNDILYRQLSISVPAKEKYPNEFAAYTIADLFGFTGFDHDTLDKPPDWMVGINEHEHTVVLAQKVEGLL